MDAARRADLEKKTEVAESPMVTHPILIVTLDSSRSAERAISVTHPGISFREATSIEHAQKEILEGRYRTVVLRCRSVSEKAVRFLRFVQENQPTVEVIVTASTATVEDTVKAMKAGASDFIVGDSTSGHLTHSIFRAVFNGNGNGEITIEQKGTSHPWQEPEVILIGQSPAVCEIRSAIRLAAKSQASVLITGESGTGKEIVAQLIHRHSDRSRRPFIALNCAALPKDIIENELFGHEKGAFTGALTKKAGCFEIADRGSLFFDEVAEMVPETQAKLLRAIEHMAFRPLGGKGEIKVDVRMIAATNKNISAALKSGQLREDLYYRLNVIEISLPPLRERREDIPLLADHFNAMFSASYGKPGRRFSEESLELVSLYDWPGNIRELKNLVERLVVTGTDEVISANQLPERITSRSPMRSYLTIPIGSTIEDVERSLILHTLASVGNNKSTAAKILGVTRATIHNKLRNINES